MHGTAAGVFRQGSLRVSVASPDGKVQAVATGTMLPQSVAGKIEGAVSVGDYSCSNNGHTWALTRP